MEEGGLCGAADGAGPAAVSLRVVRVKNGFSPAAAAAAGYRDVKLSVVLSGGSEAGSMAIVGEVQVRVVHEAEGTHARTHTHTRARTHTHTHTSNMTPGPLRSKYPNGRAQLDNPCEGKRAHKCSG